MSTAFDYSGLAEVASSLLTRFGRSMTLTRADRTPAHAWLTQQGDAAAAPAQSVATIGVMVPLERSLRTGTDVDLKRATILLRAESELPEQMGPEWKVVDGARELAVLNCSPLQPGGTLLLYKTVVEL